MIEYFAVSAAVDVCSEWEVGVMRIDCCVCCSVVFNTAEQDKFACCMFLSDMDCFNSIEYNFCVLAGPKK